MDFFSAVRDGDQSTAPTSFSDAQVFANAVEQRFGSQEAVNIIRARLTPVKEITVVTMSPSPSASQTQDSFLSVAPSDLASYINDDDTLIVDIRPHAAYTDARIPRALSLSVPSTLLKRPLFSLEKLAAMLPSPSHRSRFSAFRSSTRILIYDADAQNIPPSSNICGLLRKFKAASYSGELLWLRGGFQAVWREQRHLVDAGPPLDDNDEDEDRDSSQINPSPHSVVLRPKNLPMSAFAFSSTTVANNNGSINTARGSHASISNRRPFISHHQSIPMQTSLSLPPSNLSSHRPAANPFYDTIRQNAELSQGVTERIPLRLAPRVRRRINDLPFPWLQEIAKRADLAPQIHQHHRHPPRIHPRSHTHRNALRYRTHPSYSNHDTTSSESSSCLDSSDSDSGPSPAFVEEGTEALAMQFYRIELAEQRRLMGVMEHHSRESGREVVNGKLYEQVQPDLPFPFSITAGVEKGAKNRYRHIWPFEHARVRLQSGLGVEKKPSKDEDDYVNASYIQPLGTNRRYIGTQGPLEETFEDFWRLTWQQNVHVIVMLTKEVEGGMVKCGAYWADTIKPPPERSFGPLRLQLVSKVGLPSGIDLMSDSDEARAALAALQDNLSSSRDGGFGFDLNPSMASALSQTHQSHGDKLHQSKKKRITTIKRTFMLTHAGYPHLGARTIVHLQYLEWPDMNVPEDPRGVLELVKEVERAVIETDQSPSPVVTSPSAVSEEGEGCKATGLAKVDVGSGIARHALGGCRPVLLHCSAGVGRTGGFITVDAVLDAVRRELREKKAIEKAQSFKNGGMEGPTLEAKDVMDVDEPEQGIFAVPLPLYRNGNPNQKHGLVMHVPAVVMPGPAIDTSSHATDAQAQPDVTMDGQASTLLGGVALPRARSEATSTRKWAENVSNSNSYEPLEFTNHRNIHATQLQLSRSPFDYPSPSVSVSSDRATPESVRQRLQSSPQLQPRPFQTQSKDTRTDSSGSTSSGTGSALPSISDSEDSRRARLRGGSLSIFPMRDSSSMATSISSGVSDKEKDMVEKIQPPTQDQGQRFRTISAPQAQTKGKARSLPLSLGPLSAESSRSGEYVNRSPEREHAHGFVHAPKPETGTVVFPSIDKSAGNPDLSSRSSPYLNPVNVTRSLQTSLPAYTSKFTSPPPVTVNYKEPRALHGKLTTPSPLSNFEEPILEVVQDMREQRMSLCQSLRQYVFVHQAIIEGALWIVDEELQREKEEAMMEGSKAAENVINDGSVAIFAGRPSTEERGTLANSKMVPSPFVENKNALSGPMTLPRSTRNSMSISSHVHTKGAASGGVSDSGCSTTSSTGKRGASPTELLKQGKKGEMLLSKRPSVKRNLGTSDGAITTTGVPSTGSTPVLDTLPSASLMVRF